ncbi:MAG: type II secretion system protein [Planctomycetota bacterium]|jgi:prepilin-type N-terminal cleavage/methylation domain-containing protein
MRPQHFNICQIYRNNRGFTLIELLVVIATISVILAILMPALGAARRLSRRIVCQSNLRQIGVAWQQYLDDNGGDFYQGVNANHLFGGWVGTGYPVVDRPLNPYLGLEPNTPLEDNAKVFRCPADGGGIFGLPDQELAFQHFGNSYQTNWLLVGPTSLFLAPSHVAELHRAINARLKNLNIIGVSANSTLLPLVGDNNWMAEWHPLAPHAKDWHGKSRHHNLAFFDGHTEFIKMRKGLYVTPEYTLLPFRELNKLAKSVQKEVQ